MIALNFVAKMRSNSPTCICYFKNFSWDYTRNPVKKGRGKRTRAGEEKEEDGAGKGEKTLPQYFFSSRCLWLLVLRSISSIYLVERIKLLYTWANITTNMSDY